MNTQLIDDGEIISQVLGYITKYDTNHLKYDWKKKYPNLAQLSGYKQKRETTFYPAELNNCARDIFILEQLNMPVTRGTSILMAAARGVEQARLDILESLSVTWLRLTPVFWQASNDHVDLYSFGQHQILMSEIQGLLASIEGFFQDLDWQLYVTRTNEIFVRIEDDFEVICPAVEVTQNDQLEAFLPSGKNLSAWQMLLTEIQMAWHNHSVNLSRASLKLNPINSLWIDNCSYARHFNGDQLEHYEQICSNFLRIPDRIRQTHQHFALLEQQLKPTLKAVQSKGKSTVILLSANAKQTVTFSRPNIFTFFTKMKEPSTYWLTPAEQIRQQVKPDTAQEPSEEQSVAIGEDFAAIPAAAEQTINIQPEKKLLDEASAESTHHPIEIKPTENKAAQVEPKS